MKTEDVTARDVLLEEEIERRLGEGEPLDAALFAALRAIGQKETGEADE